MFMRTKTHRVIADGLRDALNDEKVARRKVGRALAEKVAECQALTDQLQPFLDRQAKAKQNLRQYRGEKTA